MENLNIKIESSELITEGSKTIINFLKYNNIETLEQLLNIDETSLLKYDKLPLTYKYELKGLIDLLKYKYLNIPLIYDSYLEQELTSKDYGNGYIFINWPNNILSRMGFNQTECKDINQFATLYYKNRITILDIFKKYIEDNIDTYLTSSIKEKMSLHISSYKNNKLELIKNETNTQTYISLKKELKKLIEEKQKLEEQILFIQKQIIELNIDENTILENQKRNHKI